MKVTLPDGSPLELPDGATGADAARAIGEGLARAALGVRQNGDLRDLDAPLDEGPVEIVTAKDPDALWLIRHDAAHVLATAVMELYPGVKISIGPPIDDGFYYDFEFPEGVTVGEDDLERIEAKMREHIAADEHFERTDVSVEDALERFRKEGQDYKVELIEDLVKNEGVQTVSLYRNGPFTDLCRGPHGPGTKRIKAFKLTSVAGAYWRGDAARQMLTRIYGTAFLSKEDLEAHLKRLEEARARDHRKLGRELGLFTFSEVAPGSAFWLPRGTTLYNEIVALNRRMQQERGYVEVKTPLLYDSSLWETSGHWGKFRENIFVAEYEDREFGLKPMNCPGHAQLFGLQHWSYRDLPYRCAEPGHLHRREPSGTLHGLLRVRHFIQDDAHIFCTEEQIQQEVAACLEFGFEVYGMFDFPVHVELSTRPENRLGSDAMWDHAEGALVEALESRGLDYTLNEGDGAFYGPKIDLHMTDSLGRAVAARDRPARLPDARALRPQVRRRGQRRASARDDPPGAVRLVRALHRHPDRALRRRVPALAGARAGDGAADRGSPRRLRARGRRRAARGRAARRDRRAIGVDRQEDPRGRGAEGALHAGPGRRGAGEPRGRRAPPSRGRSGLPAVGAVRRARSPRDTGEALTSPANDVPIHLRALTAGQSFT